MSVCLSICMFKRSSHWTNFREIFYWWQSWKSAEKPQIWKYRTLYVSMFSFVRRHKFAIYNFCATINFCYRRQWHGVPTIDREETVAFPLLQWSRESATMLLCTYITYRLHDTNSAVNTQYRSNKCHALTQEPSITGLLKAQLPRYVKRDKFF